MYTDIQTGRSYACASFSYSYNSNVVGLFLDSLQLLVFLLVILERRRGFITSGVLFIYWTLVITTNTISFYCKIIVKVSS